MAARALGEAFGSPPRTTALGSLIHYITHADAANYQPANIAFDLLPPVEGLSRAMARDRRTRRQAQCRRALDDIRCWLDDQAAGRGPSAVLAPRASEAQATP